MKECPSERERRSQMMMSTTDADEMRLIMAGPRMRPTHTWCITHADKRL